ncbi:MAG: FAD-dependent oxidoreductase [Rhodobacteraceae bacterium]|nr:FAD-dependent oxidoreductase [Paracoccaceae bacterium]
MTKGGGETWCVAGGGMLGQVLALRLAEHGKRVTLLEGAQSTGGLAAAETVDGITWDKFYHVILPGDGRTLALLDELGLSGEVEWRRARTGFFAGGRLAPLDGAVDYLRLPTLGPVAKARIAMTLMMAARRRDGAPLEHIRVKDWLTRWSGREAFDRLWQPLLRAKLGTNDDIASAAFIWATIRRLYLARSAGAKTETLGFVSGGYRRVLEALESRLSNAGVTVRTGCPVRQVTRKGPMIRVNTADGSMDFDHVVSTLPCAVTRQICGDLSPELSSRLGRVVYQGIVCASVVMSRPLASYYLTYLTDADLPFTAVVEMSALTGRERFGGKSLVYLPRYATQDDPFWDKDDTTIRNLFIAALTRIYPGFSEADVLAFKVSRVRNVMAVPTLGYGDIVPPVSTNTPGLHIVNSAQITDGTLNVDATLGVIDRALPILLGAPDGAMRSAA